MRIFIAHHWNNSLSCQTTDVVLDLRSVLFGLHAPYSFLCCQRSLLEQAMNIWCALICENDLMRLPPKVSCWLCTFFIYICLSRPQNFKLFIQTPCFPIWYAAVLIQKCHETNTSTAVIQISLLPFVLIASILWYYSIMAIVLAKTWV